MTFSDVLEDFEYIIKEKNNGKIKITKNCGKVCEIVLIFVKETKELLGFVKPTSLIDGEDQLSHLYSMFKVMKSDGEKLADMFGFKLVLGYGRN